MEQSQNINFLIDLTDSLEGSGIYSSAIRIRNELNKRNFNVTINSRSYSKIIHLHTALPMSFLRISRIKAFRKKKNSKYPKIVIHGHTTVEDFVNSFLFSNQLKKFLYWYLPKFYNFSDHVIAVSNHNKNLLLSYGIPEQKISVISNGIKIEKKILSQKMREETRNYLGLKENEKLIIGLGVCIYRKGIDQFIDIANQMHKIPEYKFIWIGKRLPTAFLAHATYLKKKFKLAKKIKNCRFSGYVSYKTLLGLFSAADIFLFPTREENQGIAFLEAILYNKPAIISDHPVFDEYKDGYHVLKASTVDQFVTQIKLLATDKKLEKKLISNSKSYLKIHDLNNTIDKLVAVYSSLLNEDN